MVERVGVVVAMRVERRHANADAQCDGRIGTGIHGICGKPRTEALGAFECLLQRCIAQQHAEFLAAQPRHQFFIGRKCRLQPCGELSQALIAARVSVAIVDRLEMVEVEDQQRQRRAARAPCPPNPPAPRKTSGGWPDR